MWVAPSIEKRAFARDWHFERERGDVEVDHLDLWVLITERGCDFVHEDFDRGKWCCDTICTHDANAEEGFG